MFAVLDFLFTLKFPQHKLQILFESPAINKGVQTTTESAVKPAYNGHPWEMVKRLQHLYTG